MSPKSLIHWRNQAQSGVFLCIFQFHSHCVQRFTAALTELILKCMFCFIAEYFLIYSVHLLGTSKSEQALLSFDAARLKKLFVTAHALAKNRQPYTLFMWTSDV